MKKRVKLISSLCFVLVLMGALCVGAYASSETSHQMKEWGEILRDSFSLSHTDKNAVLQSDNIYAEGKNAVVSNQEIEQATKFYMLSGLDEDTAKEQAIDYTMQREALYQAAIENGYSVTDEEVNSYLDELKSTINEADNKDDVDAVISQFDSEDDYWNYEFSVYKKDLSIQSYVHDLEQKFNQQSTLSTNSLNSKEGNDSWSQSFEQIKNNLVKEENYQIVND